MRTRIWEQDTGLWIIDGVEFEWIDCDEDGADISVNMAFFEPRFQVLQ